MQSTPTIELMANMPFPEFLEELTVPGLRLLVDMQIRSGMDVNISNLSSWTRDDLVYIAKEMIHNADIPYLAHMYGGYIKKKSTKIRPVDYTELL
jgi:hypothetical protein